MPPRRVQTVPKLVPG